MFNIVLLEPEIPANTGNIGRTCLVAGAKLHLIEPMGFIINDKNLKRAGMDYWKDLDVQVYDSFNDFIIKNQSCIDIPEGLGKMAGLNALEEADQKRGSRLWMATTKARLSYDKACFRDGDYIMFGKESAGIPEEILIKNEGSCIRIPMAKEQRSLNLSNSAAILLYEALRQNAFPGLEAEGDLHHASWPSDDR